jgi:Holliday junction resolvase RusA-like endonuclease
LNPEVSHLLDQLETPLLVLASQYLYAEMKPQAKQSAAFGGGRAYVPKKKRLYLEELSSKLAQSWNGVPIIGKVRVVAIYSFPWRKIDKNPTGWALMDRRPDIDNLFKPLADCLEAIGLLGDDAQIVEMTARKIRHSIPAIYVRVDQVADP